MRYWWVLSGSTSQENNHFFDLVEELSVIGIGWHAVGNVQGASLDEIKSRLRQSHTKTDESRVGGMIDNFANQMQIGDIALTRIPQKRRVLIGRIIGEYIFDDSPNREILTHTRKVEWLKTDISNSEYAAAFVANGKEPAWGRQSVWNADQHAEEIKSLLEESTEALGNPPSQVIDTSNADKGLRFGLERDLQDALEANLHQLEAGLELLGVEQTVTAGRLDILARDRDGAIVVIELKAGTAQPESVTQLLAYMGTIENLGDKPVRGILVAHDFPKRVLYAAKALKDVSLRSYSFTFSFSDAEKDE